MVSLGAQVNDDPKNVLLSVRDAYYIGRRMLARITADTTVSTGEAGVADVPFNTQILDDGTRQPDSGWATAIGTDPDKLWLPDTPPGQAEELNGQVGAFETTERHIYDGGSSYPVTLEGTVKYLVKQARLLWFRHHHQLQGLNTYKSFVVSRKLQFSVARAVGLGVAESMGCAWPGLAKAKRRRVSSRIDISAKRRAWKGAGVVGGYHGGQIAWRNPRGRRSLSEAEWLIRYSTRWKIARKRKDGSRVRLLHAPATKFWQPGDPGHMRARPGWLYPESGKSASSIKAPRFPRLFSDDRRGQLADDAWDGLASEVDPRIKKGAEQLLRDQVNKVFRRFR